MDPLEIFRLFLNPHLRDPAADTAEVIVVSRVLQSC